MRRILLVGPGGAGKSTLARRLSERLGLSLVHLDALYWRPGWVEPPKDVWRRMVEELLRDEAWVMDGNFGGATSEARSSCGWPHATRRSSWTCRRMSACGAS